MPSGAPHKESALGKRNQLIFVELSLYSVGLDRVYLIQMSQFFQFGEEAFNATLDTPFSSSEMCIWQTEHSNINTMGKYK